VNEEVLTKDDTLGGMREPDGGSVQEIPGEVCYELS